MPKINFVDKRGAGVNGGLVRQENGFFCVIIISSRFSSAVTHFRSRFPTHFFTVGLGKYYCLINGASRGGREG